MERLPLALMISLCLSCVGLATSQRMNWETVQSVGGLRVDDPVTQGDGRVFLPVACNVSGLENITIEPTSANSALAVRKVDVKIRNDGIQIQIITCVADHKHVAAAKGVELGRLKKGKYRVQYLNPDGTTVEIREVEVK